MMSEELVSPVAMMDLLQSLSPADAHGNRDWADWETLRNSYRARSNDPLVQHIQISLNHVVDEWNDKQVEDFWVNYLLEPPQSDEFRSISAQERRTRLRQLSKYLFDQT